MDHSPFVRTPIRNMLKGPAAHALGEMHSRAFLVGGVRPFTWGRDPEGSRRPTDSGDTIHIHIDIINTIITIN